jgi:DNA-binding ferritin-like protein
MIDKLIATLFLSREVAHREHLRVTGPGSFSIHMALNTFYLEVVEKADAITEAYQGKYGIIASIPILTSEMDQDIDDFLEEQMQYIEDIRYSACDKKDTAIQNLIDEGVALYLSTLYKLRNLR